jgi:hypothetical protein
MMGIGTIKHALFKVKITKNIVKGRVNMQNIGLVREILLYLEKLDEKYFNGIMEIGGYGKSEIDYCLQQMIDENLLTGHLLYDYDDVYFHGVALSRKGYHVLDVARNDDVWMLFRQRLDVENQSIPIAATVDILNQLSKDYLKSKFGL